MTEGIEAGKAYRIKGESKYFIRKYQTPNPTILIEKAVDVEKEGWNPPSFLFLGRAYAEDLPVKPAWYGHIVGDGRGEIVLESELETIT